MLTQGVYEYKKNVSKIGDRSRERPEGSLFNSYYTKGASPFPGLLHFPLDTYLILLSAKQRGINYHFKVFDMTRPGVEPRSPGPLGEHSTH